MMIKKYLWHIPFVIFYLVQIALIIKTPSQLPLWGYGITFTMMIHIFVGLFVDKESERKEALNENNY